MGIAVVGTLLCLAGVLGPFIRADINNSSPEFNVSSKLLVLAGLFCIAIGAIAPNKEELKAYAAYSIGTEAMNSQEAQRLIDAAINCIDATNGKE